MVPSEGIVALIRRTDHISRDTTRQTLFVYSSVLVRSMRRWAPLAAAAILGATLLGCQTTPPVPPPSRIQPGADGFAPKGASGRTTMDFSVIDRQCRPRQELAGGSGQPRRQRQDMEGERNGPPLDAELGRHRRHRRAAPEGSYVARLSVVYSKTYQPISAESAPFVLDRTPPVGSLTFDPPELMPNGQGVPRPTGITITAVSSVAKMDSWSLEVLDQEGKSFRSFEGKWPGHDRPVGRRLWLGYFGRARQHLQRRSDGHRPVRQLRPAQGHHRRSADSKRPADADPAPAIRLLPQERYAASVHGSAPDVREPRRGEVLEAYREGCAGSSSNGVDGRCILGTGPGPLGRHDGWWCARP